MINLPKNLTIFFDKNGISMSEANHIANMIKEINKKVEARILQTGAAKEVVTYDGKDITLVDPTSENLLDLCQKPGQFYSLSAWLRESIDAKDKLLELCKKSMVSAFMTETEKEPEFTRQRPVRQDYPDKKVYTEIDVLGDFTVAERAEYYLLEAQAAHIGKRIHNNNHEAVVVNIRKELQNFKTTRVQPFQRGTGPQDYIVTRTPVYDFSEIDKTFFELQALHRDVEKRLNSFKARLKNEVVKKNAEATREYAAACQVINIQHTNELQDFNREYEIYTGKVQNFNENLEARRLDQINEIAGWKIVIPHMFQEIFDYVKNYKG
jgi:hypothetical protein